MTIGLCKEGALVMEGCKHQRHYCPRLGDEWSPSCLGQLPCLSSVLGPIILVSHSLSFGNSQTPAWCQCEWRVRSLLNNTSRFFVLLLKEKWDFSLNKFASYFFPFGLWVLLYQKEEGNSNCYAPNTNTFSQPPAYHQHLLGTSMLRIYPSLIKVEWNKTMFHIVQGMLYLQSLKYLLPKYHMCHEGLSCQTGHGQEPTLPVSLKQGNASGSCICVLSETSQSSLH